MKLAKRKKQAGFALQEVALALLILLIVGVVGLTWFNRSRNDANVQAILGDIPSIMARAQAAFNGAASYAGASGQVLHQNNVFPPTYTLAADGTVTSSWGGAVTAAAQLPNLRLTFANMPTASCPEIVNRLLAPSVVNLGVGAAANANNVRANGAAATPIQVGAACSGIATQNFVLSLDVTK